MHEELYDQAKRALDKLFGDTSVPQETTKISLQTLRDEIDIYLDCLEI